MTASHLDPALERVAAFSDGIFAVAITLLVLDLVVPDLGTKQTDAELQKHLVALLPEVFSFVLSFVVVAVFWLSHHRLFRVVTEHDRGTLYFNLLFLLTVCFIPFPTGVLAHYGQLRTAAVVYALSISLAGAALALLWWYAGLRPGRHRPKASTGRYFAYRALATTLVFLLSIPVVLFSPTLGELSWAAVLPVYLILGRIYGRRVAEDLRPSI